MSNMENAIEAGMPNPTDYKDWIVEYKLKENPDDMFALWDDENGGTIWQFLPPAKVEIAIERLQKAIKLLELVRQHHQGL